MTRSATAELGSAEARSVPRVGCLVYRVERRLRARLDEELRLIGVSTSEYMTLSLLRERDGLSCAQLARWALVTPQAMNLVISALERRKLVCRRPQMVEVVSEALRSFAHSLQATNPSPRPLPLGGTS